MEIVSKNYGSNKLLRNLFFAVIAFLIIFLNYFVHYDSDKIFFIASIIVLLSSAGFRMFNLRIGRRSLFFIVLFSFVLMYYVQLLVYNVVFNNTLMELLAVMVFYLVSFNLKREAVCKILYSFSVFIVFFSLLNFRQGGYFFQVQGVGILASYSLLIPIFYFSLKHGRISFLFKLVALLLLFLMQVRMPILSWLVFEFIRISHKRKLQLLIGLSFLFPLFILIMGEDSRLFSAHTSGRYFIWLKAINAFDFDKSLFFGMGDRAAQFFLSTLPSAETFATMHNEYLRVFYDLGIVGLVILFLLIFFGVIHAKGFRKVFPIILSMQMFTDNVLTYVSTYLFFMILLINYETQLDDNENKIVSEA